MIMMMMMMIIIIIIIIIIITDEMEWSSGNVSAFHAGDLEFETQTSSPIGVRCSLWQAAQLVIAMLRCSPWAMNPALESNLDFFGLLLLIIEDFMSVTSIMWRSIHFSFKNIESIKHVFIIRPVELSGHPVEAFEESTPRRPW